MDVDLAPQCVNTELKHSFSDQRASQLFDQVAAVPLSSLQPIPTVRELILLNSPKLNTHEMIFGLSKNCQKLSNDSLESNLELEIDSLLKKVDLSHLKWVEDEDINTLELNLSNHESTIKSKLSESNKLITTPRVSESSNLGPENALKSLPPVIITTEHLKPSEKISDTPKKLKITINLKKTFDNSQNDNLVKDLIEKTVSEVIQLEKNVFDIEPEVLEQLVKYDLERKTLPKEFIAIFLSSSKDDRIFNQSHLYIPYVHFCAKALDSGSESIQMFSNHIYQIMDIWSLAVGLVQNESSKNIIHTIIISNFLNKLSRYVISVDSCGNHTSTLFDETSLIMISSRIFNCIPMLTEKALMEATHFLCQIYQLDGVVSEHVQDLLFGTVLNHSIKLQLKEFKIHWILYFILVNCSLRAQNGQQSLLDSIPIIKYIMTSIISANDVSTNMISVLSILVEDCHNLHKRPEWIISILVHRSITNYCLKILLTNKDLKSEVRIRLMEIVGKISQSLRSFEIDHLDLPAFNNSQGINVSLRDSIESSDFCPLIRTELLSNAINSYLSIDSCDLIEPKVSNASKYPSVVAYMIKKLNCSTDKSIALFLQILQLGNGHVIRAKALKEISRIITSKKDPLLLKKNFIGSIIRSTQDPSPCVRESAIEVFSISLLKDDIFENFDLLHRLVNDASLAVQKKAIRCLQQCLAHPDVPIIINITSKALLINHISFPESTTSAMAYSILMDMWMIPMLDQISKSHDPTTEASLGAAFSEQIISITQELENLGGLEKFKSLIKRVLDDKKIGHTFKSLCQKTIDYLFRSLVDTISRQLEHDESLNKIHPRKLIRFILTALINFLEGGGASHRLSPIINGVNEDFEKNFFGGDHLSLHYRLLAELILVDDSLIVQNALELIKMGLRDKDKLLYRQVPDMCANLVRLSLRGSEEIVRLSLECLFIISTVNASIKQQISLIYTKLMAITSQCIKSDLKNQHNVTCLARAAYSIGVIYRCSYDLKYLKSESQKNKNEESSAILDGNENWPVSITEIVSTLRECVVHFGSEEPVRVYTAMAAAEIIGCNPLIALQDESFGTLILKNGLNCNMASVRLVLVKGFNTMLERDSILDQRSKFSKDSSPQLDYSSAICTVLQSFIEDISESICIISELDIEKFNGKSEADWNQLGLVHTQLVISGCSLIGQILEKGLSHPQMVLPLAVSLWCSMPSAPPPSCNLLPNVAISSIRQLALATEETGRKALEGNDRFMSMCMSLIIRNAFKTSPKGSGSKWTLMEDTLTLPSTSEINRKSLFQSLLDSVKGKTRRMEFLGSLIRELQNCLSSSFSSEDILYARFLSEAIASLSLQRLEEAALLIKKLDELLLLSDNDTSLPVFGRHEHSVSQTFTDRPGLLRLSLIRQIVILRLAAHITSVHGISRQ